MDIDEINTLLGQKYPASARLTKTSKGYTWEIKIRAETFRGCLDELSWVDEELKKTYGGESSG